MNRRAAVAEREARAVGKHGLDFRDDRERDFLRRVRAEVEAGGREKIRGRGEAGVEQISEQLLAAPDGPSRPT